MRETIFKKFNINVTSELAKAVGIRNLRTKHWEGKEREILAIDLETGVV